MPDKIGNRDTQDEHANSPASIGSPALTAAVLFAPSPNSRKADKPKSARPVPPDTD